MKAAGQKITMLTAYDYTMAGLLDAAGVEGILVGDSMSMVVQGHANTLPVTLDEMIYHAEMVGRAVQQALVVVDMPFPSLPPGQLRAIENAGRILKETRCQAVKLEGGADQAEVIAALVSAGIPVMAHCGLRPQSVHQLGGYKVQRDERAAAGRRHGGRAGRRVRDGAGMHSRRHGREDHRGSCRSRRSASAPARDCDGQVLVTTICSASPAATCRGSSKPTPTCKTSSTRPCAISRRRPQRQVSRTGADVQIAVGERAELCGRGAATTVPQFTNRE